MEQAELLHRIDSQVIAFNSVARDCAEVAGFLAMLDPSTELRFLNYAIPMSDEAYSVESVNQLVDYFRSKDRMPRLEFRAEAFPRLPALLQSAGFESEARQPVMACAKSTFAPRWIEGLTASVLEADDDIRPAMLISRVAFETEEAVTPDQEAHTRSLMSVGTLWASCVWDGATAISSAYLTVSGSTAELAGVGTVPSHRRRGAASLACTCLLERFFGGGGELAWLSAGDEAAAAVYECIGFRRVATQENWSKL